MTIFRLVGGTDCGSAEAIVSLALATQEDLSPEPISTTARNGKLRQKRKKLW